MDVAFDLLTRMDWLSNQKHDRLPPGYAPTLAERARRGTGRWEILPSG